jgi:hypothetical protein
VSRVYATFDVSAGVRSALAHHRSTVTFELRVPSSHERDLSYGRRLYWYQGVSLTAVYNSPPVIDPASRTNGGFPCGESAPAPALGSFMDMLQARATDADPDDRFRMQYEFAVWPADDPAARTVLTDSGTTEHFSTVHVPAGALVDGRTYEWQVRVADVYVDNGQPVGGVGVTGTFTFSPPIGWTEVSGYQCSFDFFGEPTFVAAGPDGRATISWAPEFSGGTYLKVVAVRPDGTLGDDANYHSFQVA